MSITKDIESLIPHRKPFLFVDEIITPMLCVGVVDSFGCSR